MTHGKFCAKCLSHFQENLSNTRLVGTGLYSELDKFRFCGVLKLFVSQLCLLVKAVASYPHPLSQTLAPAYAVLDFHIYQLGNNDLKGLYVIKYGETFEAFTRHLT